MTPTDFYGRRQEIINQRTLCVEDRRIRKKRRANLSQCSDELRAGTIVKTVGKTIDEIIAAHNWAKVRVRKTEDNTID